MDIFTLSLIELRTLQHNIDVELKSREKQSLIDARTQIADIARSLGLSLTDLFGSIKEDKVHALKGIPAPIKYRNPANFDETWSGRGRQPFWVKLRLEAGETLASLEIVAVAA